MKAERRAIAQTAMIVDDSFFMRNMLRSILEIEGYRIVGEAGNGQEAVDSFRTCRPDLILMDIIMPEKNGIEATREIIRLDRNACVIICTMKGQDMLVRSAREAGAQALVLKPYRAEEVLEVLQEVTAAKSARKKEVRRGIGQEMKIMDS